MTGHDILVVTLPPYDGGVPAKTRLLCRHLAALGHRVTVAWYATFTHQPSLNVPMWQLPCGRRPGIQSLTAFDQFAGKAVGCWLPELEAPYYRLSSRWQTLIDHHDRHIAVGGQPLVANVLARAGVPHFLWCASDIMADRLDRQKHMSWPRAVVDAFVTRPWLAAQQRFILTHTPLILGVSNYTLERLRLAGAPTERLARLPIPVDTAQFTPPPIVPGRAVIGFAARFEDPRKNLPLLLAAMVLLRQSRPRAVLRLAGSRPSAATLDQVRRHGLSEAVEFAGVLPMETLPEFYRGLDVFALPSWQEGLCLAGLEAMACGVPVVSTACGGPTDFVRDGKSGYVVGDWRPESLAAALERALDQRPRLSEGARAVVTDDFSLSAFASSVAHAWTRVWGAPP